MKLTITKKDSAVYKNGVVYMGLNLPSIPDGVTALQFNTSENIGHIEYTPPIPNDDINSLPTWANDCLTAWDEADYIHNNPPTPTPEELLEQCKVQAKIHLSETDWVELSSVSDASSNPHLLNKEDFITYRNTIRNYVVNPVTEPVWPTVPTANWST